MWYINNLFHSVYFIPYGLSAYKLCLTDEISNRIEARLVVHPLNIHEGIVYRDFHCKLRNTDHVYFCLLHTVLIKSLWLYSLVKCVISSNTFKLNRKFLVNFFHRSYFPSIKVIYSLWSGENHNILQRLYGFVYNPNEDVTYVVYRLIRSGLIDLWSKLFWRTLYNTIIDGIFKMPG